MPKQRKLWSKFVFILLAMVLVGSMVVMAACDDDDEDEVKTPTPTATKTSTATPTKTVTPTATPTATAQPGVLTIDSKIGELVKNPDATKVLIACGIDPDNPAMKPALVFTLPALNKMAPTQLTQEMVDCVDSGLQALAAGTLAQWLASK